MPIVTPTELSQLTEHWFLTVPRAAVYLDTHQSYIRRLIEIEKLPSHTLLGRTVLWREDLAKEFEARQARRKLLEERRAKRNDKPKKELKGYYALSVRELQRELRFRQEQDPERKSELKIKGRKAQLVARIRTHNKVYGTQ